MNDIHRVRPIDSFRFPQGAVPENGLVQTPVAAGERDDVDPMPAIAVRGKRVVERNDRDPAFRVRSHEGPQILLERRDALTILLILRKAGRNNQYMFRRTHGLTTIQGNGEPLEPRRRLNTFGSDDGS